VIDANEALQYMAAVLNDYEARNQILQAENTRLRDNFDLIIAARDKFKAESARLREALEAIVECGDGPCDNVFHQTNIQVARAALGKEVKE